MFQDTLILQFKQRRYITSDSASRSKSMWSHEWFISGATLWFQTTSHNGSALTANFVRQEVRSRESCPWSRAIWTSWIMWTRMQRRWKIAKPYVENTGPFCTLSTPSWRPCGGRCLNCTVTRRATAWRIYRTSYSNERLKSARMSCRWQT